MQSVCSAILAADGGSAAVAAHDRRGGASVSSKYRLQQKRSLKYFIASSPEMKKRGAGEARGEIKGKIWREAERHEEVEGGRKGFMRV